MQNQSKPSRWEQRDFLSKTIRKHSDNYNLVKIICSKFLDNSDYSWDSNQLTVEDEALILQILRFKGYGINDIFLNQFPSSIQELRKYTFSLDLSKPNGLSGLYKKIKQTCLLEVFFFVISVLGIICFYSSMFWYSLLFAWAFINCIVIVVHEGWGHGYIESKNKIFGYIFDLIASFVYLLYNPKYSLAYQKSYWKYSHRYHHTTWTMEDDGPTQQLKKGAFRHIFINYVHEDNLEYETKLNFYTRSYINTLDPVQRFVETNSGWFVLVGHIALLCLLSFPAYFYFVFLQIWYARLYLTFAAEYIPHKLMQDNRDLRWIFPIFANTAYHLEHHARPALRGFYLGEGWVKYINIQYWFIKLFYQQKVSID